jgi:hypothetical protein
VGVCGPQTPTITERYPPPYVPLGEVESFPLNNGAPGRLRRQYRRAFAAQYRTEGRPQVGQLHGTRVVIVIVDGAVITQLALLIEDEYFGCALRAIVSGDFLAFVELI